MTNNTKERIPAYSSKEVVEAYKVWCKDKSQTNLDNYIKETKKDCIKFK